MIAFSSALATQEAVTALHFITDLDRGDISVSVGRTMQVIEWINAGLSVLFALGVSSMLRRSGYYSRSKKSSRNDSDSDSDSNSDSDDD